MAPAIAPWVRPRKYPIWKKRSSRASPARFRQTLWPWYHLRFCGRRWFPRQQISEYWVNLVILTTGGKGGKVTDTVLTLAIRRLRRGHERSGRCGRQRPFH